MMGLIDHPLTPLIVDFVNAVSHRAAYDTEQSRRWEDAARDLLNAALEELKND